MTFSIPQPIPSRSSHPVHAHQRPVIRRSQSNTTSSSSTQPINNNNAPSTKFGLSRLLASSDHHLHHPDIGGDLTLTNEDDEDELQSDDDDEEEDEDSAEVRIDSGHYSSDMDLAAAVAASESRGIPIGKPSFLLNQKNTSHLYGTAGGSVDSRSRLSQDMQNASSRYKYSHSHSNSDSHHNSNVIADNFRIAAAAAGTAKDNDTVIYPSRQQLAHFQQYRQPLEQQQQQQQLQQEGHSNNGFASPSDIASSSSSSCSPSIPSPCPAVSLPSPSLSPVSIPPPQRTSLRRKDAVVGQLDLLSSQGGFEHNSSNNAVVDHTHTRTSVNSTNTDNAATDMSANSKDRNGLNHHTHTHTHPNISIDTSKSLLQMTKPNAAAPALPAKSTVDATVKDAPNFKRIVSVNNLPKSRVEGQISFGLKMEDKSTAPTIAPSISNTSSTRPLMMASQSRLSSALPPTPSFHQPSFSAQDSVLLPSLSPSSPRSNSALVNSLEQLSVSWKAPEHTPSFPINRLHRSRTISTSARPNLNLSFSSNSTNTNGNMNLYENNSIMSPNTIVTSSSYSSLPYSPAVAFLSNFVEATAPRMALDEEGEQVGDFIMGKIIGHGGFSLVREAFAIHLDGLVAQVAVKIVKTQTGLTDNDRVQRMLDKEIAIWSRLSHPNVLPFLAVEHLPTDTFVFCELCTGGNLLDYLTKQEASSYMSPRAGVVVGLDETHARLIFNQVAEAVRYLHEEKRIVHRDIKLENILQHEDGTWKICDFGLAEYQNDEAALYFGSPMSPTIYNPRAANQKGRQHSPSSMRSQSSLGDRDGRFDENNMEIEEEEQDDAVGGSLAYCSPEQLRSQKPLRCPSSDVWSLGVVLYALLTGRLPFQDEYEPRLQFQILNGRYEDPTECSAEARDLLKNMFKSKPEERWKIGQVIDSTWCMGTTLESSSSFGDFGGGSNNDRGNGHAKMNNFFATFRC
ncbi:hypothetical protein EDD11_006940 [Mortierella claussenii]|nr:hypothetical protein EDD11_006940 [Mortierella claussenii]